MKAFEKLGRRVQERWRRTSYAEASFSEIATAVLSEVDLAGQLAFEDVVDHFLLDDKLGPQSPFDFGEPPLILFQTEEFYIEVLPWLDGTVTVHQHGFSGAFQVLEGSSLHSVYSFTEREQYGDFLVRGDLQLRQVEVLHRGDVRSIESGNKFIHAAFHLERPSVTIVVRTRPLRLFGGPQFSFSRATGTGWDPFHKPELLEKRIHLLRTLAKTAHPRLGEWLVIMLNGTDLFGAYRLGLELGLNFPDLGPSLREAARNSSKLHHEVVGLALTEAAERRREVALIGLRKTVHSREHRFLLALLLNVADKEHIFELVRKEFTTPDPLGTIVRWITELSTSKGAEGPPLGIRLDDAALEVFQLLLEGHAGEGVLRVLEGRYGTDAIASQSTLIGSLEAKLRDVSIFRALFGKDDGVRSASSEAAARAS